MKNTAITYSPYGAQLTLTLTGKPDELSRTVNTFHNFGLFLSAAIPDTYKPDEDSRVVIAVTKARVLPTLQTLAEIELAADKAFTATLKGKPGSVFKARAAERAMEMFRGWHRLNLEKEETPREGRDSGYAVDADQMTAEFKRAKRNVMGAISRHVKSDAKRKGTKNNE